MLSPDHPFINNDHFDHALIADSPTLARASHNIVPAKHRDHN